MVPVFQKFIPHTDAAIALEILKKDFHLFQEQVAKEKAEADDYRACIAELEKEQFLFYVTLEHQTAYNDSLDRVPRFNHTRDPSFASRQIFYISQLVTNSVFFSPTPRTYTPTPSPRHFNPN